MKNKCNIESVCYSYRHDFGILNDQEQKQIRTTIEEVLDSYEKGMTEPFKTVPNEKKSQLTLGQFLSNVIVLFLSVQTIFFAFSASIYVIDTQSTKWLIRTCIAIASAGFLGLILKGTDK